ncbi:hypothetical protein ACFQU7_15470 [Pseudoroseomonas wenyumeiae]
MPDLDLDLRELPGFVAECGYFAGVRSGLCDLLALCAPAGVQSRTVYMRGAEHCIGLADFGMAEVVADFAAHSPRALAEALFADWLAARPEEKRAAAGGQTTVSFTSTLLRVALE